MDINKEDLKLNVEHIMDFDSFNLNGYSLWSFFRVQEWSSLFDILNGSTYTHLVRDFSVRVELYDKLSDTMEETQMVLKDKSLTGKRRNEWV